MLNESGGGEVGGGDWPATISTDRHSATFGPTTAGYPSFCARNT
jgi:hypothetical protein